MGLGKHRTVMVEIWNRLPHGFRLAVFALLAALAVLLPELPQRVQWATAGLVVVVLPWCGAFRLRGYVLRILGAITAMLIGFAVFLVITGQGFGPENALWTGGPVFLVIVSAAGVAIQGFKLSEWVYLTEKLSESLSNVVIGMSCASASLAEEISLSMNTLRSTDPERWFRSSQVRPCQRVMEGFLNLCIVLCGGATAMSETLSEYASRLRTRGVFADPCVGATTLRLDEVYDLPHFAEIYAAAFDDKPIHERWRARLIELSRGRRDALEIGAGAGRVSRELAHLIPNVCALEKSEGLAHMCSDRASGDARGAPIRVWNEAFPGAKLEEQFGLVVMHQNVLLELVNEHELDLIWARLASITAPGADVAFDYPWSVELPPIGTEIALIEKALPGIGSVSYSYRYVGQEGRLHRAHMHLDVESEARMRVTIAFPLGLLIPSLDEVTASAERHGFELLFREDIGESGFIPGRMALCAVRRMQNGGADARY